MTQRFSLTLAGGRRLFPLVFLPRDERSTTGGFHCPLSRSCPAIPAAPGRERNIKRTVIDRSFATAAFLPALALAALLAQWTSLPTAAAEASDRPNFVFIMADDLGWADVGFHGGNAPTPNLDKLAKESLELTQHYVAPVCSPTRCGLLTGRCWSRFGVTTPTNRLAMPMETVTLPRELQAAGYETCLIGKWHLGSLPKWGPSHFGFDHCYGSLAGGVSPWNHRYKKGPYSVTWHRNETLIEESGHVTDLLTDEAVEWIAGRGDSPFFLYLPYTAVHLPLKEPQAWLDRVPSSITGEVPRHYAASVMHLDQSVGRILDALQANGFRDNTLLVFTSDNGGSTAENNDLKYPDDNCPNGRLTGNNDPLRGGKGDVYEGGTRVPTLVSWPGKLDARKVDTPVQIIDWMPTFGALANCDFSQKAAGEGLVLDGINIADLFVGGGELPERAIYTVGPRYRARSLRVGPWKLVEDRQDQTPKLELFHIGRDPEEAHDLAEANPEQFERMVARMEEAARGDVGR